MPRYANAQTISFTDERIKAQLRHLPLAGRQLGHDARLPRAAQGHRSVPGRSLVDPRESRPQSLYRGRRAPRRRSKASSRWRRTACSRSAAIPATTTTAATLQAKLDQAKLRTDMLNSARYLKAHALSSGQARRHRLLLGRRHDELPRRRRWAPTSGRGALLRRRAGRRRRCRRSRRRC